MGSKFKGIGVQFEKMSPSKERRKYFLGCDAVGTEREDPALAFTTSPKAHWLKLRADNV